MKIDLLGVKVDNLTKKQVIEEIKNLLGRERSIFIVTPYSESIVTAQKDSEFRHILNSADIALPDGIGILWAAHFLHSPSSPGEERRWRRGRTIIYTIYFLLKSLFAIVFNPKSIRDPIPEKISGSDFIWDLAELAAQNNYSIFLLGGFDDTPEKAATALKQKFPNLKIAGTSNNLSPLPNPPPQGEGMNPDSSPLRGEDKGGGEIISLINSASAPFLLVALGPKTQEKWIYQNLPNLRVKLAIGLGGTFDYLAGKKPYRAQFWGSHGLEWLWRLLTQPRRLGRIIKGVLGLIYYSYKAKIKG